MLPVDKLESLKLRHEELEELLCRADVISDGKRYAQLRREHGELGPLVETFGRWKKAQKQLAEDRAALADPELPADRARYAAEGDEAERLAHQPRDFQQGRPAFRPTPTRP